MRLVLPLKILNTLRLTSHMLTLFHLLNTPLAHLLTLAAINHNTLRVLIDRSSRLHLNSISS